MGMKLVRAADYAIRAMIHLACLPEGRRALRSEIARAQRIPESFMAKVLGSLVQARLLTSSRGVSGGFSLARPAGEITLLDIVEAIEGPLTLVDCAAGGHGCAWIDECPAAPVWAEVHASVQRVLKQATLESLVSMPRRNGRIAAGPPALEGARHA